MPERIQRKRTKGWKMPEGATKPEGHCSRHPILAETNAGERP